MTASSASTPSPSRAQPARGGLGTKLLPSLGILLVTGGLLLLAWFAWLWFNPAPAPYRYTQVKEGGIAQFSQLGLDPWPDLTVAQYEIHAEGVNDPVALATTARRGAMAPILISWENRSSELLISLDSKLSELTALAAAIDKYAGQDARILAWWDTSRQLKLLTGRDTLFTAHLGEPLIIPAPWQPYSDSIRHQEDQFWGAPASADERRNFQRFADALIAEPARGAAILRELAGKGADGEAYVVIHVTDLYKLGLMRPEQFDITYKHFPMEGNMHGMIGYLKKWMQENNFATYTLQSLSDSMVRGYFLRDDKSGNTLLAQMLPFTNSMPLDLTVLQLIYQQGGYWVYKIPSTGDTAAAPADTSAGTLDADASSPATPAPAAPPALSPAS
ncbi:hydroxylamine oxidation protein HaoB [Nitrosospira lacus]|uniref:hydroxylamine oxidation protein HaoB n=1 Tax=Nitrosospira lacus TaxID=1288494 RepID=UPI001D130C7B|nr:hydroxylamine oxidation protein HaoB [Nitrosospira lacus]